MTPDTPDHELLFEAQHAAVEELLSAYADDELEPEQARQVDAHLMACALCRRQLELSTAVDARLAREPLVPASPALRARVLAASRAQPTGARAGPDEASPVAELAVPSTSTLHPDTAHSLRQGRWSAWERRTAWSGWLVAAGLAGVLLGGALRTPPPAPDALAVGTMAADPQPPIPMVAAAAADFRFAVQRALPGRVDDLDAVRATVAFPVTPLSAPDLELLGAWTTTIRGEPAAALAYRWRDRVLVQYVVPEHLFALQPEVQRAVAASGAYTATAGAEGVVAWPGARSGSLLVGAADPTELLLVPRAAGL